MAQRSAFWSVKDILSATQGRQTVNLHILFQKAGRWTFTLKILMWKIVHFAGKWYGCYYRGVSFQWWVHCISYLAYLRCLWNEMLAFFILQIEVNVALIHNFPIYPLFHRIKHFLILPSQKCKCHNDVIRCMTFDHATSYRVFPTKLPLVELFYGYFIPWKMCSDDELSSNISSSSDVESLKSVREGKGWFNSIVQPYEVQHLYCRREKTGRDGERWVRRRCYTLCNLRISIWKQGNSS